MAMTSSMSESAKMRVPFMVMCLARKVQQGIVIWVGEGKRREKEDVSIGLGDLENEVSEEDSVVLGVGRCVKVNLRQKSKRN